MSTTVRISNVAIPANKRIFIGLSYIYGVGVPLAKTICGQLGINDQAKFSELSDEQLAAIRTYITKNLVVEADLRRKVLDDIKALIAINCYKGVRHKKGLPVRGQRTKNNARTRKGKKKSS
jgi:small subunit ribosomal protein S13